MFTGREATLDDWNSIKELARKVHINAKYTEFHRAAIENVDLSEEALSGYLINSLISEGFKFFVLLWNEEVQGFLICVSQVIPCFKTPGKLEKVGFIPSMFTNKTGFDGTKHLVALAKDYATRNGLKYLYANVKVDGAYSHFLEHYGAQEISRTLYVETEKING